jgi:hypothetical protein
MPVKMDAHDSTSPQPKLLKGVIAAGMLTFSVVLKFCLAEAHDTKLHENS